MHDIHARLQNLESQVAALKARLDKLDPPEEVAAELQLAPPVEAAAATIPTS